jgi:hypothetical protein
MLCYRGVCSRFMAKVDYCLVSNQYHAAGNTLPSLTTYTFAQEYKKSVASMLTLISSRKVSILKIVRDKN